MSMAKEISRFFLQTIRGPNEPEAVVTLGGGGGVCRLPPLCPRWWWWWRRIVADIAPHTRGDITVLCKKGNSCSLNGSPPRRLLPLLKRAA